MARPKGAQNKVTGTAKEAIERAFHYLETRPEKGFQRWAEANETLFYTALFPKLLPLQVNHAGEDGGILEIRVVERVIR